MSERPWTPGPLYTIGGLHGDAAIYDEIGIVLGQVLRDPIPGLTQRPALANATLWAAAPDLYEALELLRTMFDPKVYIQSCDCSICQKLKRADKALAKARGEANP